MAKDYKLCPNCNNALDLNVNKCPYCGNYTIFNNNTGINENRIEKAESTVKNKKTGCGCGGCLVFLLFLAIVAFTIFVEFSFREI